MVRRIKEYKNYYLCECPNPFHNDTHPSALLWKDTGILRCMSCDFIAKVDMMEDENIYFSPSIVEEEIKYYSLSERAKNYLQLRGINEYKELLVSPDDDSGVGILQTNVNGGVIGMSIRLFNPIENNMRYIFKGKKAPFSGSLAGYYSGMPLIAFEKTFAWLRAKDESVSFVSTNGTKSDWGFWRKLDLTRIAFVFDNDYAGRKTRDYLLGLGAHAFISVKPTDEIELVDLIEKVKEKMLWK